jgi:hypothetical protein
MFVMIAVLQWPRWGAPTTVIRVITVALKVLRATKNQAEALPRYLFIYRTVLIKISRALELKLPGPFKKLNQKCNI